MNAVAADAAAMAAPGLRAPWSRLSPTELLEHFRSRRSVRYFAVADERETTRDRIDALCAGRFEFNGETHELGAGFDWLRNPSVDVEWHILLHKFYYAVGLGMAWEQTGERRYADRFVELVDSWMRVTPPGFIAVDVAGRRVQNWIYAYLHFVEGARAAPLDAGFHLRWLGSIESQVEHIRANLTPKRNHRTLELYAVFLAGVVFPEFELAAEWRSFATRELAANMQADLLADGVHCELSTDYHHLVVKNYLCVLRLAHLNDLEMPASMHAGLQRALEFAMHVHKPDGEIPSFSDGDSRGFLELLRQGHELYGREDFLYVATQGRQGRAPSQRVACFRDAGYVTVREHWGQGGADYRAAQHLVFDCGPVGEGNHGHFDCLSFELAAHGRSLVVDPGRYTYSESGDTNWRVWFRGTASHNTVCVDGLNQTRYAPKPVVAASRHAAGSVRHRIAGPHAQAQLHEVAEIDGDICLRGSVRSAEYDAVHTRHLRFVRGRYWLLVDRLVAASEHEYVQRLQLAPAEGSVVVERDARGLTAVAPGLLVVQAADPGLQFEVRDGWVSPEYGVKHRAPALCASRRGTDVWFVSVLWPLAAMAPRPAVRLQCSPSAASLSVEVQVEQGTGHVVDHFSFGHAEAG